MIDKVSKSDCVGCKACGDICPKDAISFSVDYEGFWYPAIDMGKCIKCNLCERACPALNVHRSSEQAREIPKTYKVYHKDKDIRYNSTSGALYYALAQGFDVSIMMDSLVHTMRLPTLWKVLKELCAPSIFRATQPEFLKKLKHCS